MKARSSSAKALGAGKLAVASVFFAEATLLALLGGVVGFAAGGLLARQIGRNNVKGLGLTRRHQSVEVSATPENMGMVRKSAFMFKVEEL